MGLGQNFPLGTPISENEYAHRFLKALSVRRDPQFDAHDIEDQKGGVVPHTYEWLLDDATLQRWKDAQGPQLLMIQGPAGTGKTMMTLGLCRHLPKLLSQSTPPDIVASYFCQATHEGRNSTVSILKGLIYSLVDQRHSLLNGVQNKYGKQLEGVLDGPDILDNLRSIITHMVQDNSVGKVYLIIDALDECPDWDLLFKIMKSATRAQNSKAKWLFTSRPAGNNGFRGVNRHEIDQIIDLNHRTEQISSAVKTYVDSRVKDLAGNGMFTTEKIEQIKSFLKDNSNGTFLWVAIVLSEIGRRSPMETKLRLPELLRSFPLDLENLYKRMAQQIQDDDVNRKLLSAIIYAQQPLHLKELAIFADLGEDFESQEDLNVLRSQLDHCGSLLIARGDTVTLIHQTVKDYFTRSESHGLWLGDSQITHASFATQCLDLMSQHLKANVFSSSNGDIGPSDEIVDVLGPLFQRITYACLYWVDHLELAGPESYSGEVHQFMHKHFLHWLEAMAYMGEIPKAKRMISKLQSWTQEESASLFLPSHLPVLWLPHRLFKLASWPFRLILIPFKSSLRRCWNHFIKLSRFSTIHSNQASLATILHDADDFIRRFESTITTAPLQVYLTALIFSPLSSSIRQQYLNSWAEWIKFKVPPSQEDKDGLFEGHTKLINAVAFSPDSKLIASASDDSTVRLWHASSGTIHHTFLGGGMPMSAVAFAADGEKLAAGSVHGIVTMWSTDTGEILHQKANYDSVGVESLDIASDSKHILCGYENGSIHLWPITDNAESLLELQHGESPITAVSCAPGFDVFVSGSVDGCIQVWDSKTGLMIHRLDKHQAEISSLVFSSSGLLASSSLDHTIRLWDFNTGTQLASLTGHRHHVYLVTWLKDNRLASASTDGTIRMWECTDINRNTAVKEVRVVRLWDDELTVALHQLIHNWTTYGSRTRMGCFAISPDATQLIVGCPDTLMRQWDLENTELLKDLGQWVETVKFSPDGRLLAAGAHNGLVQLWDTQDGKIRNTAPPLGGCVSDIHFSEDSTCLYITVQLEEKWVWRPTTGEMERCAWRYRLPRRDQSGSRVPRKYRLDAKWIKYGGRNLFLLPPGMDGISYDCFENTVAIGHTSGRVSIYEFVPHNLSFPGQCPGKWHEERSRESSEADVDEYISEIEEGSSEDSEQYGEGSSRGDSVEDSERGSDGSYEHDHSENHGHDYEQDAEGVSEEGHKEDIQD